MAKLNFYQGDLGGCGILRIVQPAKYFKKLGYDVNLTWLNTTKQLDSEVVACVFQRDYLQPDVPDYWKWLKARGIKIIYDLDDDIFDVPKSNPNYSFFQQTEIRQRFEFYLRNADLVTTTTEYLKNRLLNFNSNTIVLPNCIDFETWPKPASTSHREIRLGWAGSPTHYEDLMLVYPALKSILKRYNNVQLYLLGFCPNEFLKDFSSRLVYVEGGLYEVYQIKLSQLSFDIGFMPLTVNGLNKSKSPVKFLEYSALQIPSIASYDSPYKNVIVDGETGYLAKTVTEWEEKLEHLINHKAVRKKLGENSFKYVFENYNMSTQIGMWENAIQRLFEGQLTKKGETVLPNPSVVLPSLPSDLKELEERQLVNTQYNIAKLFVKNKEVLITDAHAPSSFAMLLNSGARKLQVLEKDQQLLLEVTNKYRNPNIEYGMHDFDTFKALPLKKDYDLILSFGTYDRIKEKKHFLICFQKYLKKFGTFMFSAQIAKKDQVTFVNSIKYYYSVLNIIVLNELIDPEEPKTIIVFCSKY